ncbi:MAG: acyl carrier protein [Betaproteobacteria bacterium]
MDIEISQAVRRFISENFMFRDDGNAIAADASLLEAGIIDSTGVLELICFLESTYDFQVADEEMLPENLDSIRAIVNYISRKVKSGQAALVA